MDKTDIGKSGVKISSIGLGGGNWGRAVSYTHLTLPTSDLV